MKKTKYEKLIFRAERLEQKSLKARTDRQRWRLQDKADKIKELAYSINLNSL